MTQPTRPHGSLCCCTLCYSQPQETRRPDTGCLAIVSDGYENDRCGKPALPGNTFCLECRPNKLKEFRDRMARAETEYLNAKTAYEELLAQGQPPTTKES